MIISREYAVMSFTKWTVFIKALDEGKDFDELDLIKAEPCGYCRHTSVNHNGDCRKCSLSDKRGISGRCFDYRKIGLLIFEAVDNLEARAKIKAHASNILNTIKADIKESGLDDLLKDEG